MVLVIEFISGRAVQQWLCFKLEDVKTVKLATLQRQSDIGSTLRRKKMAKKRVYKDYANYDEFLQDRLKDPELAMAYLNEALHDEDQNVFLIALKDVCNAQSLDVSTIAKKAHISRQSVYRMLSQQGNPRWNNITSLIDAMGLQVQISHK